jgi:hypothetical protein
MNLESLRSNPGAMKKGVDDEPDLYASVDSSLTSIPVCPIPPRRELCSRFLSGNWQDILSQFGGIIDDLNSMSRKFNEVWTAL